MLVRYHQFWHDQHTHIYTQVLCPRRNSPWRLNGQRSENEFRFITAAIHYLLPAALYIAYISSFRHALSFSHWPAISFEFRSSSMFALKLAHDTLFQTVCLFILLPRIVSLSNNFPIILDFLTIFFVVVIVNKSRHTTITSRLAFKARRFDNYQPITTVYFQSIDINDSN